MKLNFQYVIGGKVAHEPVGDLRDVRTKPVKYHMMFLSFGRGQRPPPPQLWLNAQTTSHHETTVLCLVLWTDGTASFSWGLSFYSNTWGLSGNIHYPANTRHLYNIFITLE